MTRARPTRVWTWKRVVLAVVASVVALEVLYLIGANIFFRTNFARQLANGRPEVLHMGYSSAFTPWPGRVYARDFEIQFQDHNVAFSLSMATSRMDIALLDLFSRKFHATHALGTGVSYRMLFKVDTVEGAEDRVAAFPTINGVESPPIRVTPKDEAPLSEKEIDALWGMEFNGVESELSEVWIFEYRYLGRGKSVGSFGIQPLKRVWVGPVWVRLEPGALSVGPHQLSETFSMKSNGTVEPFDISTAPGLETFKAITGRLELELPLSSLDFVTVYLPGAKTEGGGTISADVQLKEGKLQPETKLNLDLEKIGLGYRGFGFKGSVKGAVSVGETPVATASVGGTVTFPMSKDTALNATVQGAAGTLSLASVDLSDGFQLGSFHAGLEKAEAKDARPLVDVAAKMVPFFARQILGDGPLTAAGTVDGTSEEIVFRVSQATLGKASLQGAMALRGNKLFGAAEGLAGDVTVGVEVNANAVKVKPLPPAGWREEQLRKFGISPARRLER